MYFTDQHLWVIKFLNRRLCGGSRTEITENGKKEKNITIKVLHHKYIKS